ncbi:VanZ family protein [Variovorax sp. ZS18.2.2]|uniref:VanZ family protein n=1 Tax=Variovorax sp. ZS18.2.2 TaxID=2971255 RepID=UPI0021508F66|nr:VanZ family protein [Variovorax sp. ZS18.2.2]MCR6477491.1 VanZ family protein [Variovorax sp. ZS18.2.2]
MKHQQEQLNVVCRLGFWGFAIAILVLALVPSSSPIPTTGWDKTNHLLAFAVLAFLGNHAWPGRTVAVLLGLLVYGGLIEVLQSFTADRFAEWWDLLADGVGLVFGELAARLGRRHVRSQTEAQSARVSGPGL